VRDPLLDIPSQAVEPVLAPRALSRLVAETGILVGGSSGATLCACRRHLEEHPEIRHPVCLCADDGANYSHTIFNDRWLDLHDVAAVDLCGSC
jgi:hypothetical protein